MTPEGRVKAAVKRVLSAHSAYYEMPVPGGYGKSGLDFTGCHRGRFFAIETKAPGKVATPRQVLRMREMEAAGGKTFEIDGNPAGMRQLEEWLSRV